MEDNKRAQEEFRLLLDTRYGSLADMKPLGDGDLCLLMARLQLFCFQAPQKSIEETLPVGSCCFSPYEKGTDIHWPRSDAASSGLFERA